jgi:hypothetical protein
VRDCVKPNRGSAIRVYDSEEPLVLETVHHCSAPLCRSLGGPIDPASSKHHRRSNLKMNTIFLGPRRGPPASVESTHLAGIERDDGQFNNLECDGLAAD